MTDTMYNSLRVSRCIFAANFPSCFDVCMKKVVQYWHNGKAASIEMPPRIKQQRSNARGIQGYSKQSHVTRDWAPYSNRANQYERACLTWEESRCKSYDKENNFVSSSWNFERFFAVCFGSATGLPSLYSLYSMSCRRGILNIIWPKNG